MRLRHIRWRLVLHIQHRSSTMHPGNWCAKHGDGGSQPKPG
jgi:hypothetical protein